MATEGQTSACLLCASAPRWFNLLFGTSSKTVYHRDAETQRHRVGELRGEVDEAPSQSAHHSSLTSAPQGSGIATLV